MAKTTTTFPLLKVARGHTNPPDAVSYWRTILRSQGYTQVAPTGLYDEALAEVTRHFQMVRIDRSGRQLKIDGEVGPDTWWAGLNPSGDTQRNWLEGSVPKGLSAQRREILRSALADHAKGVREIPDGANYGDGVTRYLEGIGPAFWCCYAVSTWCKDGTGDWPFGVREGLVAGLWNRARQLGRSYDKSKVPVPGDAFIILYRHKTTGRLTGLGHTGLVAAVGQDFTIFNGVEGNAGNRVKLTRRDSDIPELAGFVDLVGDSDVVRGKFSRGLFNANGAPEGVAGTR